MKLNYSHSIVESRDFGKSSVSQRMITEVDFKPEGESIEVLRVDLFENGLYVAEISKLLHKAEGNPLSTILDAIDWKGIYDQACKKEILNEPFEIVTADGKIISQDDLFTRLTKITTDYNKLMYGI